MDHFKREKEPISIKTMGLAEGMKMSNVIVVELWQNHAQILDFAAIKVTNN